MAYNNEVKTYKSTVKVYNELDQERPTILYLFLRIKISD